MNVSGSSIWIKCKKWTKINKMKAFVKGITMQNNMTTFTFMLLFPEYSRMEFILLFM